MAHTRRMWRVGGVVLFASWIISLGGSFALAGRANVRITGMDWLTLDGKQHDLASVKGKTVLWYFWSTSVKESVQQMRHLVDLYKTYGQRDDFVIVSFSLDGPDRAAAARQVVSQLGAPWQQVIYGQGAETAINQQIFQIKADELPAVTLMSGDATLVWSGKADQADQPLGKLLGVEVPAEGRDQTKPLGAMRRLAEAIEELKDDAEFSPALDALEAIPEPVLSHPQVMPLGVALLVRMKMNTERAVQLEQALSGREESIKRLRLINQYLANAAERPMPGLVAPRTAARPEPIDPSDLADRKLGMATKLREAGKHAEAYRQLKQIVERWSQTPAAEQAAKWIADYEADSTFMAKQSDEDSQRRGRSMLSLAEGYAKANRKDLARTTYQKLIEKYPDSQAADAARQALKQLK